MDKRKKEIMFIDAELYELLNDIAKKMSKDSRKEFNVEDVIKMAFANFLEDLALRILIERKFNM